ncbi:MAG: transposase family protein [Colwellia sp.]|nr:transposase family protein [Colwellia sp.]
MTISICAIIRGCDDFCAIEKYGKSKLDWFKSFLDLKYGTPSHDTSSDVLSRVKLK